MVSKCRGCGAETLRTLARYDERMNFLGEVCNLCRPDMFEVHRDPSDKKIYAGPQAFPHLYTRNSEGVYQAKDELIADTVAEWDKGPTAIAEEKRRATRRTTPMSDAEIAQAKSWAERSGLAPEMRRRQQEELAAGRIN